jgi:hypothetical protein
MQKPFIANDLGTKIRLPSKEIHNKKILWDNGDDGE